MFINEQKILSSYIPYEWEKLKEENMHLGYINSNFDIDRYTEIVKVESADGLIEIFDNLKRKGDIVLLSLEGELSTSPEDIKQYFEEGDLVPGLYGVMWEGDAVEAICDPEFLEDVISDLEDQINYFKKMKK